ncbi:hypothetical protein V1282_005074 [Nitrobacteraceae bacterium AZCC 2146]
MVLIAEYCWSYVKHEDSYITVSGLQVGTIKTLLDALTARARGQEPCSTGCGMVRGLS